MSTYARAPATTWHVRALLLLLALGALSACPNSGAGECTSDRDCDGEVCARDGACLPASDVRAVKVRWTLSGQPPSTVNCEGHEDLFVHFEGPNPGETVGFAPVPCFTGQFTIDKLPTSYDTVEVGIERGASTRAAISGPEVVVDLPL